MADGNILKKVRAEIAQRGGDEFSAVNGNSSLADLKQDIQNLKIEMVEAKKIALKEVHDKYTSLIDELERNYAFMLKLSS